MAPVTRGQTHRRSQETKSWSIHRKLSSKLKAAEFLQKTRDLKIQENSTSTTYSVWESGQADFPLWASISSSFGNCYYSRNQTKTPGSVSTQTRISGMDVSLESKPQGQGTYSLCRLTAQIVPDEPTKCGHSLSMVGSAPSSWRINCSTGC